MSLIIENLTKTYSNGFNLFGGRSYFSLVLSSVSSPPGYPKVGKSLLFINVPLLTTEEFFLILVFGLFFTENDNFKLSPGYKGFFNLYMSKLYRVSSKTSKRRSNKFI